MQKKWVVRVVSGLAGYWNARMTGFSRLGALIYATIIMVMINDGGFGRYLGRFSRKGISFSNRTKNCREHPKNRLQMFCPQQLLHIFGTTNLYINDLSKHLFLHRCNLGL